MAASASSNVQGRLSRIDDIEVGFDDTFQDRFARTVYVIRTVGVIFILLGLSGALGRGPLAHATGRSPDGTFSMEYDRLLHARTPAIITVDCANCITTAGDTWRLTLRGDIVKGSRFDNIVPQPIAMASSNDSLTLTFAKIPGAAAARVSFTQEPMSYGPMRGDVQVNAGERLPWSQFTFP
jgi:hypothetical protein